MIFRAVTEPFRVFGIFGISEDGDLQPVFRRYSWCFSSLIIFSWSLMLILEILVLTVFTSLDSTIESSEMLVLHVDSLSLFSWGISKSHVSPAILQLLFSRISLLRSFLIISFFFLRNSISLSRLIISFLSTTVWYSFLIVQIDFLFYFVLYKVPYIIFYIR